MEAARLGLREFLQMLEIGQLLAAGSAVAEVAFKIQHRRRVELAVVVGIDEVLSFRTIHTIGPSQSVSPAADPRTASCNRWRARERRDMTVPIATPVTFEISA